MAEQNQDGQEKTEEPTPRRLEKAREEGQVARSRELTTMGVLLAGTGYLAVLGHQLAADLAEIMRNGLNLSPERARSAQSLFLYFEEMLYASFIALAPFLVVVLAAAALSPMLLGGWSFSTKAMAFKFERMDPIKGLKKIFALRGLMELGKALAKFAVVLAMLVALLWWQGGDYLALGRSDPKSDLVEAAELIAWAFLILSLALVVIAAVDVPFQIWDHTRQLRMTKQEVKDEYKETEGKPEVKSKIASLQREAAMRRMMESVPQADVVVTNPTHYAVALRYKEGAMGAPVLVAKGRDLTARRIRELAAEHGVPILRAPLLARAVYASVELDREIPQGLYLAVAQVLAYVFQLRRARSEGGPSPAPPDPDHLPVPEEFLERRPPGRRA